MWADNVVWLNIYLGDEKIGDMGLVAKKVSMECGIKNLSVMLFELDATKLKPLKSVRYAVRTGCNEAEAAEIQNE